jgi:hypothetical protein
MVYPHDGSLQPLDSMENIRQQQDTQQGQHSFHGGDAGLQDWI